MDGWIEKRQMASESEYRRVCCLCGCRDFINTARVLRSVGLGPLGGDVWDWLRDKLGKPVLNLDYLLRDVVQKYQPLDWERFRDKERHQPLKASQTCQDGSHRNECTCPSPCILQIVASGLVSRQAVVLDSHHGNFASLPELAECMRASMLLPGIAGPVVRLNSTGSNVLRVTGPAFDNGRCATHPHTQTFALLTAFIHVPVSGGRMPRFRGETTVESGEPMADALLYEPIPYRSAVRENATHILVLRTRPDGVRVTGAFKLIEKLIMARFFKAKNRMRDIYTYMKRLGHKVVYAEDILWLNNRTLDVTGAAGPPHALAISPLPDGTEITRSVSVRVCLCVSVSTVFVVAR